MSLNSYAMISREVATASDLPCLLKDRQKFNEPIMHYDWAEVAQKTKK